MRLLGIPDHLRDRQIVASGVWRPGQRLGCAVAAASIVTSRPRTAACDACAACVHAQGGPRRRCGAFPRTARGSPLVPLFAASCVKGWRVTING